MSDLSDSSVLGAAPFDDVEDETGGGQTERAESQSKGQQRERGPRKRHRVSQFLPKKPKKAASAYSNFIKAYYKSKKNSSDDNVSSQEKFRRASMAWREVGTAEREALEKKCAKDKERYNKEMGIWKKKQAFLKRPPTTYGLFLRDFWANEKAAGHKVQFGAMIQSASTHWKELGNKKKEEYQHRHTKLMRHHSEKMWHLQQAGSLPNLNWMKQGLQLEEAYPVLDRRSIRRAGRESGSAEAPSRRRGHRESSRAEKN